MAISKEVKKKIEDYLIEKLDEKIKKYEPETTYAPFIASLIRDKPKVAAYSLVHSIQTTLGMSMYEQVSKIIAETRFDKADTQWKAPIGIGKRRLAKIEDIITDIGNGIRKPNRKKEEKEILAIPNPRRPKEKKKGRVVDLHLERKGKEFWFDIKTVKPNNHGFLTHHRSNLEWIARADKSIVSAIVFPYNPYHPNKYWRSGFDVLSNDDVMIGSDYWDFLGGKGCYRQVLNSFNKVGKKKWPELEEMMEAF